MKCNFTCGLTSPLHGLLRTVWLVYCGSKSWGGAVTGSVQSPPDFLALCTASLHVARPFLQHRPQPAWRELPGLAGVTLAPAPSSGLLRVTAFLLSSVASSWWITWNAKILPCVWGSCSLLAVDGVSRHLPWHPP